MCRIPNRVRFQPCRPAANYDYTPRLSSVGRPCHVRCDRVGNGEDSGANPHPLAKSPERWVTRQSVIQADGGYIPSQDKEASAGDPPPRVGCSASESGSRQGYFKRILHVSVLRVGDTESDRGPEAWERRAVQPFAEDRE